MIAMHDLKLNVPFEVVLLILQYYIVDMGGFGHRVNSDSIRNGGAI